MQGDGAVAAGIVSGDKGGCVGALGVGSTVPLKAVASREYLVG